jgi:hypothetical protein
LRYGFRHGYSPGFVSAAFGGRLCLWVSRLGRAAKA